MSGAIGEKHPEGVDPVDLSHFSENLSKLAERPDDKNRIIRIAHAFRAARLNDQLVEAQYDQWNPEVGCMVRLSSQMLARLVGTPRAADLPHLEKLDKAVVELKAHYQKQTKSLLALAGTFALGVVGKSTETDELLQRLNDLHESLRESIREADADRYQKEIAELKGRVEEWNISDEETSEAHSEARRAMREGRLSWGSSDEASESSISPRSQASSGMSRSSSPRTSETELSSESKRMEELRSLLDLDPESLIQSVLADPSWFQALFEGIEWPEEEEPRASAQGAAPPPPPPPTGGSFNHSLRLNQDIKRLKPIYKFLSENLEKRQAYEEALKSLSSAQLRAAEDSLQKVETLREQIAANRSDGKQVVFEHERLGQLIFSDEQASDLAEMLEHISTELKSERIPALKREAEAESKTLQSLGLSEIKKPPGIKKDSPYELDKETPPLEELEQQHQEQKQKLAVLRSEFDQLRQTLEKLESKEKETSELLTMVRAAELERSTYGDKWRLRNLDPSIMERNLREAFSLLKRIQWRQAKIEKGATSDTSEKANRSPRREGLADQAKYRMSPQGQIVQQNLTALLRRGYEVDELLEDQNVRLFMNGCQYLDVM